MMADTLSFKDWMQSVQAAVETGLDRFLPPASSLPNRLHDAMRYAALGGGKRIRALLVFASGAIFDADESDLAQAAAAIEMMHAYSLVHDDLPCMDNDTMRRGKPTVHVQYGEAGALLAGDALQAQAFATLSALKADPARIVEMLRILGGAAGSSGMCGGQAIDLAGVGQHFSLPELEQMHRLKTGALFSAAVFIGTLCGRFPNQHEARALTAYAEATGLAFQVVDDILDTTADSATLGKTAGKDAAQQKPTYVSILGLDASKELAGKLRQDAVRALGGFDKKADRLRQLADLIVQREK
ncbi:MAG: polyprenyl synthetase family protein [Alistipes senegalensis]|nr:polyprenyl synthetase family protein [Alistipes senegalensis]